MILPTTMYAGGPGSGPQGGRHPKPRPLKQRPAAPAPPTSQPKLAPKKVNYVQHATKGVQVSPNGQIKLTTPKTPAEASEMLETMGKIQESALADVNNAISLP